MSILKAGLSGVLCVWLVGQPMLAAGPVSKSVGMWGQARVLHALNRFTFGPRPGDVAAVERMGLDRWFELQLNPGEDR